MLLRRSFPMFERGPWPFLLGWLGCHSVSLSDWILLGLACWLFGFICRPLWLLWHVCAERVTSFGFALEQPCASCSPFL